MNLLLYIVQLTILKRAAVDEPEKITELLVTDEHGLMSISPSTGRGRLRITVDRPGCISVCWLR